MIKPVSSPADKDRQETEAARARRRKRIRAQSQAVAEHVARDPEAAAFYEAWGTPRAEEQR